MKKPLAVCLDIDDTIISFLGPFLDAWNRAKDDFVSLSDMTNYDFARKGMDSFLHKQERNGFYKTLPTQYGAFTFINKLNDIGLKVILLTARPSEYRSDSEYCLAENGLKYEALLFSKDKAQVINNLKLKYSFLFFADDRFSTVKSVSEKCLLPFNFLITQPHNLNSKLTEKIIRVNYILDIMPILLEKIK